MSSFYRVRRHIQAASLTILLLACRSNEPITGLGTSDLTDQAEVQTIANSTAENTAEIMDIMNSAERSANSGGASFSIIPTGSVSSSAVSRDVIAQGQRCSYNVLSTYYVCERAMDGKGFANDRQFQLRDSTGAARQQYNDTTTASINFIHHRFGVVADSTGQRGLDRTHNLVVSGLLKKEIQRTWNGSSGGADSGTVSFARGTYSYNLTTQANVSNVIRPVGGTLFPAGGSIVRSISGGAKFTAPDDAGFTTRTVAYTTLVTFDGTQTARVTVGNKTFALDLVTYRLTPTN